MSLRDQLEELTTKLRALVPAERLAVVERAAEELKSSGVADHALKEGDLIPAFELPDGDGMIWRSAGVLRRGPRVVGFFRGRRCADCNTQPKAPPRSHAPIPTPRAPPAAIPPPTPKQSSL